MGGPLSSRFVRNHYSHSVGRSAPPMIVLLPLACGLVGLEYRAKVANLTRKGGPRRSRKGAVVNARGVGRRLPRAIWKLRCLASKFLPIRPIPFVSTPEQDCKGVLVVLNLRLPTDSGYCRSARKDRQAVQVMSGLGKEAEVGPGCSEWRWALRPVHRQPFRCD
jgi:hypothetical protein